MSTEQHSMVPVANRVAAELVDRHGVPSLYDEAVTLASLAYLQGAIEQLTWARAVIRGDEGEEA